MKKVTLGLCIVIIVACSIGASVGAVDSQLKQEIFPIECVITTVATGLGQQLVAQCPTRTPMATQTTPTGIDVVVGGQLDGASQQALDERVGPPVRVERDMAGGVRVWIDDGTRGQQPTASPIDPFVLPVVALIFGGIIGLRVLAPRITILRRK